MTLFKFGNIDLTKYIMADSYDIKPNQRIDVDSYNDEYGLLHRTALKHTVTSVVFSTVPLTHEEAEELIQGITSSYIDSKQRDANCEYFDPETFGTKTGHFYLDPSLGFRLSQIENEKIQFGSINFKFTEY